MKTGILALLAGAVLPCALALASVPAPDALSDAVGSSAGSFRVDESGAATYSIPIFTTPGTAGVQPDLSLSYSSHGGEGPVGHGWSVSGTSSITRCRPTRESGDFVAGGVPVDGNPRPIRLDSGDRFCLDGQRLLNVDATIAPCAAVSNFSAQQLRTEIESFQRVCAYTPQSAPASAAGPRFFTVEGKDGSMRFFGDRRSRLSVVNGDVPNGVLEGHNPSIGAPVVYTWAQSRMQDATGNYIDFDYLKNPGGAARPGEQLLSAVRYTGRVQLAGQSTPSRAPFARVELKYQALPTAQQASGFQFGQAAWRTQRLAAINTVEGSTVVRNYRLTYGSAGDPTLLPVLHSVQECLDETGSLCLAPTTFTWTTAANSFQALETITPSGFQGISGYRLGDIDGDGRQDLVWTKRTSGGCTHHVFVAFSELDTSGRVVFRTPPQQPVCYNRATSHLDNSWHLMDYDGDGRDDLLIAAGGTAWTLHRSLGRQPDGARVFSTTNELASLSPAIPVPSDAAQLAMLADLNGDGLLDVIYPRDGLMRVRMLERNGTQGFRFGAERAIALDSSGLPPIAHGCDGLDPNIRNCIRTIAATPSALLGRTQLADFNGDAASDLLFRVTSSYQERNPWDPNCPGGPIQPFGIQDVAGEPKGLIYPAVTMEQDVETQDIGCWTTYSTDELHAFVVSTITGQTVVLGHYGALTAANPRDIRLADVNGDGLTDVLVKQPNNQWMVRINTGRGFTGGQLIGSIGSDRALQVVDINGNGRTDLLYPQISNSGGRPYRVRYAQPDGTYGPETALPGGGAWACIAGSCDVDHAYIFADISGDGAPEFARLILSGSAEGRLDISRSAAASRFMPRRAIHRVTDGMGARTELQYLPLTNNGVYRRRDDSRRTMNVGRGSPVQDFVGAMYVVARASSSAPTWDNPGAMASVFYRYVGAAVQAGGRGFLGFREIISIDVNDVGSFGVFGTRYHQDFPFTGHPQDSVQRVVMGGFDPGPCLSQVLEQCFRSGTQPFPAFSGPIQQRSIHAWEASPAFQQAQHRPVSVRTAGTTEFLHYAETGGVRTRTETTYVYGEWGNVTHTAADTYTSGNSLVHQVETTNTYTDHVARWRLGRLTSSTVRHRRGDAQVVRRTAYRYQSGGAETRLLNMEVIEPDGTADETLRTYYGLDEFGNRVASYTCSRHFSEAACKGALSEFAPQDPLRVQRRSSQTFTADGRFPVHSRELFRNGSGASEHVTLHVLQRDRLGNPTRVRNLQGQDAVAVFGAFGRPFYSWTPTVPSATLGAAGQGVETRKTYRWCGTAANQVPCPTDAVLREQTTGTGVGTQWQYVDRLGRPVLSIAHGGTANALVGTCTGFDVRGRAVRVSEPFFHATQSGGQPTFTNNPCSHQSRLWTVSRFDPYGRPVETIHPDLSKHTVAYSQRTTTYTDQLHKSRTEVMNFTGELERTSDASGLEVRFQYDPAGNLTLARRLGERGHIESTQTYDRLGRKLHQFDPDLGYRSYEYNAAGELVAQTDGSGQRVEQWFDARGRMVQRLTRMSDGAIETQTSWLFDANANGRGQLRSESITGAYTEGPSFVHSTTYNHDVLGRVIGTTTQIDGRTFHQVFDYNLLGRIWKTQDASGEWLKTQYTPTGAVQAVCASSAADTAGTCTTASTFVRNIEWDARGNVVHERRGATATLDVLRFFNAATGRLDWVCSGSSCEIQNDHYGWDAAGNLQSRLITGHYREVFQYDDAHRLVEGRFERIGGLTFTGASRPYSLQMTYDSLGNICSKRIDGSVQGYSYAGRSGCGTSGLPGSGTAHATLSPHAVTAAAGATYAYDGNGNQTRAIFAGKPEKNRFVRYTVDNRAHDLRLQSEANPLQRSRFWYGADGNRFMRIDAGTNQSPRRTYYLGAVELIEQGGVEKFRRMIGGAVIQEIVGAAKTNRFLFHDHLGSIVRITNAAGTVLEGSDFGPFGERRNYQDPRQIALAVPQSTDRGFTGHEMLDRFDVIHMNGRIYDSRLGRFLQPDPVVQAPNNPQNFNRYAYVLNNPLAYTDPSGYNFIKKYWRTIVAIAITVWTGGAAAGLLATNATAAFGVAAAGGFAAGVVQGGGLQGGLVGAFTAMATLGVASATSTWGTAGRAMASGTVGGVSSVLQGGKFGHGFVSAGVSTAAASGISNSIKGPVAQATAHAIVGGTVSKATGGKFANGAATAAMSYSFARAAHGVQQRRAARDGNRTITLRPRVGIEAAEAAYSALKEAGLLEKIYTYERRIDAFREWRDVVYPIAENYGVEIGAHLVRLRDDQFYIAAPHSSGSYDAVFMHEAPKGSIPGQRMGFIHTHPESPFTSGPDRSYAYSLRGSGAASHVYAVAVTANSIAVWDHVSRRKVDALYR